MSLCVAGGEAVCGGGDAVGVSVPPALALAASPPLRDAPPEAERREDGDAPLPLPLAAATEGVLPALPLALGALEALARAAVGDSEASCEGEGVGEAAPGVAVPPP